jgi:hypothetical protein
VANCSAPGSCRIRYIFSSRLRRKFRNAWSRLQESPFSILDID